MRASRFPVENVARLLLEPHERKVAAAIQSQSNTCILISLDSSTNSSINSLGKQFRPRIPSNPIDACFLRLEHARSDAQQPRHLQFGQFPALMDLETSHSPPAPRSFFLIASAAGSGGDFTDIRAWSCEEGHIKQVGVTGFHQESDSSSNTAARLDIPHMGLKIFASVNVVVIYSPSVSKLWIIAAKISSKSNKLALMRCSVLDIAEPIYTLHLSMQNLFLGEEQGVRILPLRPLVKGFLPQTVKLNGFYANEEALKLVVSKKNGLVCDVQAHMNGLCEEARTTINLKERTQKNGIISIPASVVEHMRLELACNEDNTIHQVMAITPLSAKAFVTLNSAGMLHMLIVNKPKSRVIPLVLPVRVSSFEVVPCGLERAFRNLWISDGKNSVYVLSIPEEVPDGELSIVPTVTQVLFTTSRVDSLVAVSAETVLAVSEGALVAYVRAGGAQVSAAGV